MQTYEIATARWDDLGCCVTLLYFLKVAVDLFVEKHKSQ